MFVLTDFALTRVDCNSQSILYFNKVCCGFVIFLIYDHLLCCSGSMPWGWSIANTLVFKKVRVQLGLDRCQMFGSAAAPIMRETLDFFSSLNMRIDECYGMSESTGMI